MLISVQNKLYICRKYEVRFKCCGPLNPNFTQLQIYSVKYVKNSIFGELTLGINCKRTSLSNQIKNLRKLRIKGIASNF